MSRSEIDNLKSRFADGVSSRLRGGGERQTGRYSDIYDFDTPKVNRKTPTKPKSASTSDKKKVARSPLRATSPRRALSPRRATSPRPRPSSQKKKIVSTPANKSKSDSVKTFKTPKSATKNVPSTSTPKSNKGPQQVKKRKTDEDGEDGDDNEGPNDSSKKRKREGESDAKTSTKKRSTLRKRVSFRGDEFDSIPTKSSKSSKTPKEEEKVDESDNNGSWWFCHIM